MPRKKSVYAEVEPAVLKWAVESSGWADGEIAKKIRISPNSLLSWKKGEEQPTITQLDNLAKALRRPLSAFFLPSPPEEKPMPKDYRMLPDREGEFDKKTILAIRKARRLQRIGGELAENLGIRLEPMISRTTTLTNPAKQAEKYMAEFEFDEKKRKKFKTPYQLFNFIRESIEDKNIFVFQFPMPVDDARGFALADDTPAIIVVNSKDMIEARTFTLMHEFGHILLKDTSISMPEKSLLQNTGQKFEKWCNDFASSFLLPESEANKIFKLFHSTLTETKTLSKLSGIYKVSKAMLLYNMRKLNFISKSQYKSVLERYLKKKPEAKKKKSKGFGAISADKKCIREKGQKFVSLVISNAEKGLITHSDTLNYLGIKSKSLDKVWRGAKR
ncbi:MAG: XRE family transcriptional regulator [Candidatus Micrarchaeota archaeon]